LFLRIYSYVKRRKFTTSKSGNRKITRFAKKQLLIHGVIKSSSYGTLT